LLSPDDDESGEPILLGENPFWQEVFTLLYHLQLGLVNKLDFPLHAVLITLTHDSNYEIHKNYISDNQNKQPEEPCQDFKVFGALND
jgi:hypothetical protein